MSTASAPQTSAPAARSAANASHASRDDTSYPNPSSAQTHQHEHSAASQQSTAAGGKKGKAKKGTDPNEASKLIAAKISQLELDQAGERDQEAEIGSYAPGIRMLWTLL